MCPSTKNRTIFLFVSAAFLIFSLCFGALAYVGHKTSTIVIYEHEQKNKRSRKAVRKQQREIKKKLEKIEKRLSIRKNKNDATEQQ